MGKRLEPVRLVADLSSQTPRRGAEENSVCNTGKQEQLSCILHNPTGETVPAAS